MKNNKKKSILFIFLMVLLVILLWLIKQNPNYNFQDELIFFKFFSSKQEEKEERIPIKKQLKGENKPYYFQVSYQNIDFKTINLGDTIKQETLIHEKIAPRNRRELCNIFAGETKDKL